MTFNQAFRFVMQWEGGVTDDPDDSGGLTRYGISQKAYPYLNIRDLTLEQARDIYYLDYWLKSRAHKLPESLQLAHFDAAVNTGVKRASKLLQKSLHVESDGIIGDKTIKAAHDKGSGALAALIAYRALFYIGLVTRKPSQSKFMFGWLRRIISIAIETRAEK